MASLNADKTFDGDYGDNDLAIKHYVRHPLPGDVELTEYRNKQRK